LAKVPTASTDAVPLEVDLSGCHLGQAEYSLLGKWTSITRLNLSFNALSDLPAPLSALTRLEHLDLSHNRLTSLPADITQLTRLRKLNLANNQLQQLDIPAMVELCTRGLQELDLKGNPQLRVPPPQTIERGGAAVRQFLADLAGGKTMCTVQTVLAVGQEAAGKTSTCGGVKGKKCVDQEQPEDYSTVGIETAIAQVLVARKPSDRLVATRQL